MQKLSKQYSAEVPAQFTREKAIRYLANQSDARGTDVAAVPQKHVRADLYKLFMKIGAMSELPTKTSQMESFLNDFWKTIYLKNHLVPADVPFGIIIEEFTTALVQGSVRRKGNNQAAICQAFNAWITRQEVRNRLIEIHNRRNPDSQPRQIPERASKETVQDYSDEQLMEKLESIRPFEGLKLVNQMIEELEKEAERRGLEIVNSEQ